MGSDPEFLVNKPAVKWREMILFYLFIKDGWWSIRIHVSICKMSLSKYTYTQIYIYIYIQSLKQLYGLLILIPVLYTDHLLVKEAHSPLDYYSGRETSTTLLVQWRRDEEQRSTALRSCLQRIFYPLMSFSIANLQYYFTSQWLFQMKVLTFFINPSESK